MTTDHHSAYAQAVVMLAGAENALDTVEDELLTVARAIDANDELRQRLTDANLPVANRLAFVESEVLKVAHRATRAVLALLIAADRAGDLTAIADEVARRAAESRDSELAEVRVAVELDEGRRAALTAALEQATGRRLDVKVIVDESVVGGVRARIGDTVIDGSVLRRLDDLRTRAGT
ncbi:MAG: ATP synthase F1 subunit delta [Nitriliruptoraceae bacterium]